MSFSVSVPVSLATIVKLPSVVSPSTLRSSTVRSTLVLSVTFLAEPVIFEISLPVPVSVTSSAGKSTTAALMKVLLSVWVILAPSKLSVAPAPIVTSPSKVMSFVVAPFLAVRSAPPAAPVSRSPTVSASVVTSVTEPASPLTSLIALLTELRLIACVLVASLSATLSAATTLPAVWLTAPSSVSVSPAPIVTLPSRVMVLAVVPFLAVRSAPPAAPVSRLPTVRSSLVASFTEPATPLTSLISLLAEERSTFSDLEVSLSVTLSEITAPPVCATEPSKVMPAEESLAFSVPPLWVKPSPIVPALIVTLSLSMTKPSPISSGARVMVTSPTILSALILPLTASSAMAVLNSTSPALRIGATVLPSVLPSCANVLSKTTLFERSARPITAGSLPPAANFWLTAPLKVTVPSSAAPIAPPF